MTSNLEAANEHTPLLQGSRFFDLQYEPNSGAASASSSTLFKDEQQLADNTAGERLPYNDYTTIDWLHDLVWLSLR